MVVLIIALNKSFKLCMETGTKQKASWLSYSRLNNVSVLYDWPLFAV